MFYETRGSWERRGRPYQPEGFLQIEGVSLVGKAPGADLALIQCPYLAAGFESLGHAAESECHKSKKDRYKGKALLLEITPHMVSIHAEGGRRVNQSVSSEAVRGPIQSFSLKSQRRMQRRVLAVGELPKVFFALTYPDDVILMMSSEEIQEKAHRDVCVLRKRLLRRWPDLAGIIRYEFTFRKSGAYAGMLAVHFHVLTYRGPGAEVLRVFMLDAWPEITGTKDPHARYVILERDAFQDFNGDIKKIERYLTKYIAKEGQRMGFRTGRHWSTFGDLPEYESIVVEVGRCEASKVLRVLRSFCKSKSRTWDIRRQLVRGDRVTLFLGQGDVFRVLQLASDLSEIPF